jgi:hypothetical protein
MEKAVENTMEAEEFSNNASDPEEQAQSRALSSIYRSQDSQLDTSSSRYLLEVSS